MKIGLGRDTTSRDDDISKHRSRTIKIMASQPGSSCSSASSASFPPPSTLSIERGGGGGPPPPAPQRAPSTTSTFRGSSLVGSVPMGPDMQRMGRLPSMKGQPHLTDDLSPMPPPAQFMPLNDMSSPSPLGNGGGRPVLCKMPNCHVQGYHAPPPMSPISESPSTQSVQTNQDSPSPTVGFNSNCQQCIAERAAAVEATTSGRCSQVGTYVPVSLGHHDKGDSGGHPGASKLTSHLSSGSGLNISDDTFRDAEETRGQRLTDPEPPARTYECEVWCRETSRLIAGCLGICCLAIGYAAVGGFLFMAIETRAARTLSSVSSALPPTESPSSIIIEGPTVMNITTAMWEMPKEVKANLDKARFETVAKLWQVTEQMNILYPDNWTRQAAEEVLWFQDQLMKVFTQEFHLLRTQALQQKGQEQSSSAQGNHYKEDPMDHRRVPQRRREWSFSRGLLYAVSLLTTVGSDADWPVSPLSRILTVIYLIIGAPIMYLYLSSTGSLLSRAIYFTVFQITCHKDNRHRLRRSLGQRANRNDKIKRSLSQTPFYSKASTSHASNEKMAMVTPNSAPLGNGPGSNGTTRRSTWQTKGGAGSSGSLHGSASVIVANGSINTLSTIANEDELNQRPKIAIPIFGCMGLLAAYVLCGAAVMADSQNWRYSEGIYFCFVSLFTVGFGGLRPDDPNLWSAVLYIFFGLALISTCAHIIKQQVFDELRRYQSIKMRHRSMLESFETMSKSGRSGGGSGLTLT